MNNIEKARSFSIERLDKLRSVFHDAKLDGFSILVVGSLARLEASSESDIDYYVFGDDEPSVERAKELVVSRRSRIVDIVPTAPSSTGAFGEAGETRESLITKIGGEHDSNGKITRRILSLLEGAYIASEECFQRYRNDLLDRYVPMNIKDGQICRFLLNDIIRYYRTICVDFEFKTVEDKKPWGIRYIKLRFSRKLLYFSGLLAVAETAGLERESKVSRLRALFELPPIERIIQVCGSEKCEPALQLYDDFLKNISDGALRESLKAVNMDTSEQSTEFVRLREEGRRFSVELSRLLTLTYESEHPIHQALIF